MEVKNRLLNFKDMYIYQNDEWFNFSMDSVLLANFVSINLSDKKIIDFCTGNAPIPMLLSYKTKANIIGVELQEEIYKLAIKSVYENSLDNRINIINEDVKNLKNVFEFESFDVVTCNPPFFKTKNILLQNKNLIKNKARHETTISLEDVVKNASYLLKNGKRFAMVHRPDRFVEIIDLLRKYNFEPKRVKLCYPKKGRDANVLLIESIKNGKPGLFFEEPLYVHNDDGSYTLEVKEMFEE